MLTFMQVKSTKRAAIAVTIVAAIAALAGVAIAALVLRGSEPGGIEDAYLAVFGKADLGPVDFATLRRRRMPNDALACRPDVCPDAAPDIVPPIFPVAGDRLRAIVAAVATADPRTELIFSARWDAQDRFLARSRIMGFPDTIDALVVGQGEDRSTIALYSRSQIGLSDFGVNRARISRWLERIGEAAAREARTR